MEKPWDWQRKVKMFPFVLFSTVIFFIPWHNESFSVWVMKSIDCNLLFALTHDNHLQALRSVRSHCYLQAVSRIVNRIRCQFSSIYRWRWFSMWLNNAFSENTNNKHHPRALRLRKISSQIIDKKLYEGRQFHKSAISTMKSEKWTKENWRKAWERIAGINIDCDNLLVEKSLCLGLWKPFQAFPEKPFIVIALWYAMCRLSLNQERFFLGFFDQNLLLRFFCCCCYASSHNVIA